MASGDSRGATAGITSIDIALSFLTKSAIAGDLIDPKMWVEILKVILLQPTTEHKLNDLFRLPLPIVGQDGDLDLASVGRRGLDHDLP